MVGVDVFVPCYNYGRYLSRCVRSVLDQTGVEVRILIIDDASSDNTAKVAAALARQDHRVTVLTHPMNKGHISTYNEGINWASATYMLLLSADDYLLPGALRRATSLMEAHPEVGFTFGNVLELGDDGKMWQTQSVIKPTRSPEYRILEGPELIELTGSEGNQVTTCSAVVRTDLQKRLGGYRPELPHAGDVEMWLRFSAHGSVGFIFDLQGVYRRHGNSMSAEYYNAVDGRMLYKKNGRLADLEQRKTAFDCFSEHSKSLGSLPADVYEGLYRHLALAAVSQASAAFNDGDVDGAEKIRAFAVSTYPGVERSLPWLKLALKRLIGARLWRSLRTKIVAIDALKRV